jgi:hypothetical protein
VNAACKSFRVEWLERPGSDRSAHARACAACRAWARSAALQIRLLTELERPAVPAALAAGLGRELAGARTPRIERMLSSLVRLGAPAELDERLLEEFAPRAANALEEQRGREKARALRALDVQPAPPVLERLVEEELRAPEAHRSARFPGDLERLSAPADLEQGLRLSVRRRALARLLLAPLATLTAAGLVLWLSVRSGREEPRHAYSFEVVHARDLDGLDPLARALAESLGGGFSGAPRGAEERGG